MPIPTTDLDAAALGLTTDDPPAAGGGAPSATVAPVTTLTSTKGLKASMSEVAAAGVQLAKCVLGIMAATVAVLAFYLYWSDYKTETGLGKSYQELLAHTSPIDINGDVLDAWDNTLRESLTNATLASSATEQKNQRAMLAALNRYYLISEKQEKGLEGCVVLPTTAAERSTAINDCLDILRLVKKVRETSTANATLVASVAKDLSDRNQNNHAFWIQIAQLLLLNLLLPLLTGLFGYIFGTTQQTPAS